MDTIIIIIVIAVILAPIIFISIKINNFKYRVGQHVLGKVGFGAADVNAKINDIQEDQVIDNFLKVYTTYNEQMVKNTIQQISNSILNNQNNGLISNDVLDKMNTNQMLAGIRGMSFVRSNLLAFRSPDKLSALSVYTDGRDEYQIMMFLSIQNSNWFVEKIDVMRGMIKGL